MKKAEKIIKKIAAFLILVILFLICLVTFYYLLKRGIYDYESILIMFILALFIVISGIGIIGAFKDSDKLLGFDNCVMIDGKIMPKKKALEMGLISEKDLSDD